MRRPLTAAKLFEYANRYAREHEASGHGTQYPTLRMVARRFRVTLDQIEDLTNEGVEDGYLGIGVALGNAVGAGMIEPRGQQLVEAYA